MPDALALDFEGTLVKLNTAEPLPGAVRAVQALDSGISVAIVTNQGGPASRIVGSLKHPSPAEVAERLDTGLRAVGLPPERVDKILICTWPGELWRGRSADALDAAGVAAEQLREILPRLGWPQAYATESPGWRKPAPGMLWGLTMELLVSSARILCVGEAKSDAAAARAAGCRFQSAREWWK